MILARQQAWNRQSYKTLVGKHEKARCWTVASASNLNLPVFMFRGGRFRKRSTVRVWRIQRLKQSRETIFFTYEVQITIELAVWIHYLTSSTHRSPSLLKKETQSRLSSESIETRLGRRIQFFIFLRQNIKNHKFWLSLFFVHWKTAFLIADRCKKNNSFLLLRILSERSFSCPSRNHSSIIILSSSLLEESRKSQLT